MAEPQTETEEPDGECDTYHGYIPDEELATHTIAAMLAELEECSPIDIGPLADCIDTDALNKLVAQSTDADFTITFAVEGYTAHVGGDRSVVLVPR